MNEVAIRVSHLSKRYRVGSLVNYRTLREDLISTFRRISSFPRSRKPVANESSIWALHDLSFEVAQGAVVGVIGRNGAGKSTLLKILSHITRPSEGRVEMFGRVSCLLEVGTGFHNELTGRENIYLNGAILGMRRQEIDSKFDEIVAFAEVERFLDTPVKHYSSGMYMRLAFAVAAHLEPEILLVDEVLAVGDAAFQKKCLGKMGQVARQGRTVLFVSHNMPAIKSLCQSGIVLSAGELGYYGPVDQAIERYMAGNDNISTGVVDLSMNKHRFGSGEMRIRKFWVEDETHQPVSELTSGAYCRLAIEYETDGALQRRNVSMSILINTLSGAPVSLVNTDMMDQHFDVAPPEGRIYYVIQRLPLTAGRYIVDLNLATYGGHTYADFIKEAAAFDVIDGDFFGTGRPGNPGAPVMVDGTWTIQGIT